MSRAVLLTASGPVVVALLSLVFPPFDVRPVAVAAIASVAWAVWGLLVPGETRGLVALAEYAVFLGMFVTWFACMVAVIW